MNHKIVPLLAIVFLLLGVTGCQKTVNIEQLEKELVGVWWDEYEYSGTTETGIPFSKVLLAIKADADHTGCIYLALFDNERSEHLEVYGGPKDAGFKWQLLEDGSVKLSDPASGESTVLTRADGGSNYGEDMTNVSNTNMTYTGGSVTVTNGSYSSTLTKADADTQAEIGKTAAALQHKLAKEATEEDLGKVIAADGRIYDTTADATNAGARPLAVIARKHQFGVNAYQYTAIAISDESSRLNWNDAKNACKNKTTKFDGVECGWMFPTKADWEDLFKANGGKVNSGKRLNALITKAGGNDLRTYNNGGKYWTADSEDDYWKIAKSFDNSYNVFEHSTLYSSTEYVRAFFYFIPL